MNLTSFPRRHYTSVATPLEKMDRLRHALGGFSPELYIKRDDQLGLTLGGNKTRKLEYLVADALQKGADMLVTSGAIQSNHCRLTAAAAAKEGLTCKLILHERVLGTYSAKASGNNLLFQLLGAEICGVVKTESEVQYVSESIVDQAKRSDRKPYFIPSGGSNDIGSLGYVSCFLEMMEQFAKMGLSPTHIVVTSGSAGTHAGLVAAKVIMQSSINIVGISIMRNTQDQTLKVLELSKKVCEKLGSKLMPTVDDVIVFDEYIGPGYSLPTPEMVEATKGLLGTEGLLLDPVYTGKAFAGMVALIGKHYFKPTDQVVFIHTGGSPGVFAYNDYYW